MVSPISNQRDNILPVKNDFTKSLQPLYFFSRAFGRLPFSLVSNLNGEIQRAHIKIFDVIWFALSISVYLFLFIYYFKNISNTSNILVLCNSIAAFALLGLHLITVLMDLYNRERFIDILKKFGNFDKAVAMHGEVDFNYNKIRQKILVRYLATLAFALIVPMMTFFIFKENREKFRFIQIIKFFFVIPMGMGFQTILHTTYIVLISLLCDRFDILHDLLRFVIFHNNIGISV